MMVRERRKSCASRTRGERRHAISKIRRAVSIKIAVENRKRCNTESVRKRMETASQRRRVFFVCLHFTKRYTTLFLDNYPS